MAQFFPEESSLGTELDNWSARAVAAVVVCVVAVPVMVWQRVSQQVRHLNFRAGGAHNLLESVA